jgi:hypothetical protein
MEQNLEPIRSKIYEVRGHKEEFYGLNRNLIFQNGISSWGGTRKLPYAFTQPGFPEDFMFQLTKEEYNSLRCHFGTSNRRGGDRRAKHNAQYPEIEFIQIPHKNHDRFLTVDNEVYLLGASVKDMGIGLCAITKMTISPEKLLSYMN